MQCRPCDSRRGSNGGLVSTDNAVSDCGQRCHRPHRHSFSRCEQFAGPVAGGSRHGLHHVRGSGRYGIEHNAVKADVCHVSSCLRCVVPGGQFHCRADSRNIAERSGAVTTETSFQRCKTVLSCAIATASTVADNASRLRLSATTVNASPVGSWW